MDLLDDFASQCDNVCDDYDRRFILLLLETGEKLNVNTDFFREKFDMLMSPVKSAELLQSGIADK
jgi:hypothetical protein